jgi:cytochrome c biogenesis factor
MWWYKLVVHWSKRDYIEFSLFTWILIFCVLAVLRIVQGKPLEMPFMAVLAFVMIPVELLIIVIFQKYSSHMDEILDYPSLLQLDFYNEQFLKSGKILVFFYAI